MKYWGLMMKYRHRKIKMPANIKNPQRQDAEITALEGKLSTARQVKQGMMSVLLTGR